MFLSGADAEAATCDAVLTPIVSGQIDWAILDQLTDLFLHANRHDPDQPENGGQPAAGQGDRADGQRQAGRPGRASTGTATRQRTGTTGQTRAAPANRPRAAAARQPTAPAAGHRTAAGTAGAGCPPCRNGPASCPPPPGNGSATPSCS